MLFRSGGFPPTTDLSLIRLSKPAPIGTEHFLSTDQSLSFCLYSLVSIPILVSGVSSRNHLLRTHLRSTSRGRGCSSHGGKAPLSLFGSVPPGPKMALACLPADDVELDDSWSCATTGWGTSSATGVDDEVALYRVERRCDRFTWWTFQNGGR